jgi:hypothetical protein
MDDVERGGSVNERKAYVVLNYEQFQCLDLYPSNQHKFKNITCS